MRWKSVLCAVQGSLAGWRGRRVTWLANVPRDKGRTSGVKHTAIIHTQLSLERKFYQTPLHCLTLVYYSLHCIDSDKVNLSELTLPMAADGSSWWLMSKFPTECCQISVSTAIICGKFEKWKKITHFIFIFHKIIIIIVLLSCWRDGREGKCLQIWKLRAVLIYDSWVADLPLLPLPSLVVILIRRIVRWSLSN